MLIAIDIGNTNITFGLFKGKKLVKKGCFATSSTGKYGYFARKLKSECAGRGLNPVRKDRASPPALSMKNQKDKIALSPSRRAGLSNGVKAIVICSVVPKSEKALVKALKRILETRVLILGKDIKVPIKNLYKNPRQVGQDRLVSAYAAYVLYGNNKPLIVIDFGTAITFDVVSKKGAYLGGLIVPGMEMSLAALSEKAALLPKVELKKPSFILGKTTKDSMTSGAFYGYAAMCDGLVSKLEKRFNQKFRVLATGGTASLVAPLSFYIKKVDVDLVLKGINLSIRKS